MTADGHEGMGALLQPSLGRQDDLSGFDKPYNPWNLVMAAFFFGPLGGGWMLANNFGRIGQRRRVVPCMLAFLGLAIVLTTILVWWSEPGVPREQARVVPWWVKRGGQALTVVVAMVVAAMQKQRYRLYEHSGGEQGPWTGYAVGLALGLAGYFGLALLITPAVMAVQA